MRKCVHTSFLTNEEVRRVQVRVSSFMALRWPVEAARSMRKHKALYLALLILTPHARMSMAPNGGLC